MQIISLFYLDKKFSKLNLSLINNRKVYVQYLNSSEFLNYIDFINKAKPEIVLGLGNYSGKDQVLIRVETIAKNKFRNSKINNFGPDFYNLDHLNIKTAGTKFTSRMGNSFCNLISYLIMENIEKMDLKTKYIFLHIPYSMKPSEINKIISDIIYSDLKLYI